MTFKCNKNIRELMMRYANPKGEKKFKAIGLIAFEGENILQVYERAGQIMRATPECGNIDIIENDTFKGCAERNGHFIQLRLAV